MKRYSLVPALILLFVFSCAVNAQSGAENKLNKILKQETIRILITDSGIGGLSVMNDIADKLKESGSFQELDLIFANALFSYESGYNALGSREEKIEMFSKALTGMNNNYKPDLIFVACNTLSVLISSTDFVKLEDNPPVIGIVDAGVKLISESLSNNTSSVIIFGTETTIDEGTYERALITMGIDGGRIINKSCPQLQSYIEQNPYSEETEMLISFYMTEALSEIEDIDIEVNVSLNCTHFGYSYQLWEKALSDSGYRPGKILNPNDLMGDILITESNKNRYTGTDISMSVISKVRLVNVESLISIFKSSSPSLASAIETYQLVEDLF